VKEMSTNITEAPNENQELVTETVTNEDGTKSIRNTLRDKATAQENTANTKISSNSSKGSRTNKKGSTGSTGRSSNSSSNSGVNQSFVANMSISRQTTQAITVVGNGGSYATLTLHTKRNGIWTETLSCSARVGKNGITSNKREGDGKTPTGIYSFGQAFGVAGNPGTSRGWLQVNNNHYWVDDVNSPYYNKLVDASQTGIQWSSAEHLIGYPTAYKYAIAVNYNTACTPGAGSAIFLHCSTGGSTAGCISVSQSNMIRILQSLQGDTLIGIYQNSNSLY
jgi:L,D-peptidoglycan transpeptidase YkuD (ErfK/YbiS/YcfS/YnhG family)